MNFGAKSDKVLPLCLLNLNWEHSVDAQGSILASPPPASLAVQISSFMDDPLNSMHANHMLQFPNDLGFVERAARYSYFNGGNFGAHPYQFGIQEAGKPSRAPNINFHVAKESPTQTRTPSEVGEGEIGSGREDSSVTDPASARGESNAKKRKAAPKSKGKVAEEDDGSAKKLKSGRSAANEKDGCTPKEEEADVKNTDPHKDYIHVRARRGQATDSHSLAERVRREKISQRMKLLQALVPGCSKITGKALMLDEIINYVQSLQRQIEFLSMKLATVDPRLDFSLETLSSQESAPHHRSASMPNSLYHLDNLASAFPLGHQSKEGNHLCFSVTNAIGTMSASLRSSLDTYGGVASQAGNLWDEELHTVLQAGFSQNQEIGENSQRFNAQLQQLT